MLYQIQHQNVKTDETTLCFQKELNENLSYEKQIKEVENSVNEAWEKYPPSDGWQFLFVLENSNYFKKI